MGSYARPATRGELRDKLRAGVPCEVVSSTAEITGSMLKGWLAFDLFSTRLSENAGWSVFEPTNLLRQITKEKSDV